MLVFKPYLLFLSTNQILPLVDRLSEVNGVHGDLNLSDDVVFAEAVKVKHLQHQSLSTQLRVRDLERVRRCHH